MKKVVNILAIVAVCSLAFTSCKKKEKPEVEVKTGVAEVQTEEEKVPVEVVEKRGDTTETRVDTMMVEKTTVTEK